MRVLGHGGLDVVHKQNVLAPAESVGHTTSSMFIFIRSSLSICFQLYVEHQTIKLRIFRVRQECFG